MNNAEKFRPTSALIMGWVLIFFFAGFIAQSIYYGGLLEAIITVSICGLGVFGTYLGFIKPYVVIFDEGIKIVNPTKEITASWDRVDEIETKYSMSIIVDGRTFYAWAAPAPSRRHGKRMHKSDFTPRGSEHPVRIGDSPRSDSGACAYIARLRRKDFITRAVPAHNIFQIRSGLFIK
ncbi:MAG: hypothetical protein ACOYK4_04845 [Candidatus Planktophila sp.]